MSATTFAVPSRADVPIDETWALDYVFPSDEAWEDALDASGERLHALEVFRGRIGDGAATLLAA
ncbi:MAG: oligoendopeptidase F, partial [Chloroflexia bacterium]|nr:oligoendopeptidase F [Chloroflexia bacterium]